MKRRALTRQLRRYWREANRSVDKLDDRHDWAMRRAVWERVTDEMIRAGEAEEADLRRRGAR